MIKYLAHHAQDVQRRLDARHGRDERAEEIGGDPVQVGDAGRSFLVGGEQFFWASGRRTGRGEEEGDESVDSREECVSVSCE